MEIKEKSLAMQGDGSGISTFEPICKEEFARGQRGYRAVLAAGQLDTDPGRRADQSDAEACAGSLAGVARVETDPHLSSP